MVQLISVLYLAIFTFGVIGYLRGFDKELIAMSGIVLAIFTLVQFNDFFITVTTGAGNPPRTLFYIQATTILVVTFLAYHTPPDVSKIRGTSRNRRDVLQNRILGSLMGGFNGYMVFGSIWYYLSINNYPLESIQAPALNTASANFVGNLPLAWLLSGNLLTLFVIGLFLFILIAII